MIQYTKVTGSIIRGSSWPPGGKHVYVLLTNESSWPEGVAAWTWKLVFGRSTGRAAEMTLVSSQNMLQGKVLSLKFAATAEQTLLLSGNAKETTTFKVDLLSEDGANIEYYPTCEGVAHVRSGIGE